MMATTTIDSREVALMVDKRHADLIRDIEQYLQYLENAKLRSQDFFVESTYKSEGNNKTYKCYQVSKKGCELIAHKMTGEKGVRFTATYINKFHELEQAQLPAPTQPDTQLSPQELQMFKLLYDGMVNQATKVNELEQKVDRLILIEESHIVPPMHEKPSMLELEVMQNIMKKDMISTTQIGARYGLSSTNFYKLLHKLGLVKPDTDHKGWLLSEVYQNKGIGTNGQSQSGGNSYSYVLWTPKGRALIEDTLKDNGLNPTKRLAPKRRKKKNR